MLSMEENLAPDHWMPRILVAEALRQNGRCAEAVPNTAPPSHADRSMSSHIPGCRRASSKHTASRKPSRRSDSSSP